MYIYIISIYNLSNIYIYTYNVLFTSDPAQLPGLSRLVANCVTHGVSFPLPEEELADAEWMMQAAGNGYEWQLMMNGWWGY